MGLTIELWKTSGYSGGCCILNIVSPTVARHRCHIVSSLFFCIHAQLNFVLYATPIVRGDNITRHRSAAAAATAAAGRLVMTSCFPAKWCHMRRNIAARRSDRVSERRIYVNCPHATVKRHRQITRSNADSTNYCIAVLSIVYLFANIIAGCVTCSTVVSQICSPKYIQQTSSFW